MSKEAQMNPKNYCIYGGCSSGGGPWCNRCGFNRYEDERRRNLPLVKGEDGISRKYVGVYEVCTE